MKPAFPIFISLFFWVACNDSMPVDEHHAEESNESSNSRQELNLEVLAEDSVPANIQIDSVIYISFKQDSTLVMVKGHLNKRGDPVICYLPVKRGKKLSATIIPDKAKANFRFSHLILPDGKSDGPFGNVLKYDLKQKGNYKLYIAPNKMAGDPVSSDFDLKIKVE